MATRKSTWLANSEQTRTTENFALENGKTEETAANLKSPIMRSGNVKTSTYVNRMMEKSIHIEHLEVCSVDTNSSLLQVVATEPDTSTFSIKGENSFFENSTLEDSSTETATGYRGASNLRISDVRGADNGNGENEIDLLEKPVKGQSILDMNTSQLERQEQQQQSTSVPMTENFAVEDSSIETAMSTETSNIPVKSSNLQIAHVRGADDTNANELAHFNDTMNHTESTQPMTHMNERELQMESQQQENMNVLDTIKVLTENVDEMKWHYDKLREDQTKLVDLNSLLTRSNADLAKTLAMLATKVETMPDVVKNTVESVLANSNQVKMLNVQTTDEQSAISNNTALSDKATQSSSTTQLATQLTTQPKEVTQSVEITQPAKASSRQSARAVQPDKHAKSAQATQSNDAIEPNKAAQSIEIDQPAKASTRQSARTVQPAKHAKLAKATQSNDTIVPNNAAQSVVIAQPAKASTRQSARAVPAKDVKSTKATQSNDAIEPNKATQSVAVIRLDKATESGKVAQVANSVKQEKTKMNSDDNPSTSQPSEKNQKGKKTRQNLTRTPILPMETPEELDAFDKSLADAATMKRTIQEMMNVVGTGPNAKSGRLACGAVLGQYINRSVFLNYTWTGATRDPEISKLVFSSLVNFLKVFVAVGSSFDSNFTERDCFEFFKNQIKNKKGEHERTKKRRSAGIHPMHQLDEDTNADETANPPPAKARKTLYGPLSKKRARTAALEHIIEVDD